MVTLDEPRCAGCGMPKSQWKGDSGEGHWKTGRNGEARLYCCSGCALGRCTCWPSDSTSHHEPVSRGHGVGV